MSSLRGAINGKCKDCIYDPKSGLGTWRQQVGGCLSPACPLYPVRPMPDTRERLRCGQIGPSVDLPGDREARA